VKALSIRQPWAWLILNGHKTVECRNWRAPKVMEGQEFLLHTGKKVDVFAHGHLKGFFVSGIPSIKELPIGSLLGRARFLHCFKYHSNYEFKVEELQHLCFPDVFKPTKYGFHLKVLEVFATPIPYPGKLGFFDVPDSVIKEALR
jgi:hypothetical protein